MGTSTEEFDLIRTSARHLLQTTGPAEIPEAVMALGWTEMLDTGPATAVTAIVEEQGRLRAASPLLDLAMQHGAGITDQSSTALLLPPLTRGGYISGRPGSDNLRVDGIALAGRQEADSFFALTHLGIVAIPASSLQRVPLGGADSGLGLTGVSGRVDLSAVRTVAPADAVDAALGHRTSLAGQRADRAGRHHAVQYRRLRLGANSSSDDRSPCFRPSSIGWRASTWPSRWLERERPAPGWMADQPAPWRASASPPLLTRPPPPIATRCTGALHSRSSTAFIPGSGGVIFSTPCSAVAVTSRPSSAGR